MSVKKLERITQVPEGALRRIAMPFREIVECYECDTVRDLVAAAQFKPLELFMIAQTANKAIERYFLVGLGMPSGKDVFTNPQFYFASVPTDNYEKIADIVNKYKTNKSVLYGPDGVKLGVQ